jgi:peptide/nickel transport system substrate-binding protein
MNSVTTRTCRRIAALAAVTLLSALPAGGAQAKVLRYAGVVEVTDLEPHLVLNSESFSFKQNVYEPLLTLGPDGRQQARLATEWTQVDPLRWRFKLRQGVTFQGGEKFSADDVVFSIERARSPTAFGSNVGLRHLKTVEKVDDFTVDFVTTSVDAIFPRGITTVNMVSKKWAEEKGVAAPADRTAQQENYATRHSNGTGPFELVEFNSGISVELKVNPNWWGGKRTDQLTGAKYFIIKNISTQVAALLSGEIDLITGLSPGLLETIRNAPSIKHAYTRASYTLNIGFDVVRDELLFSSVKGKNPFKDIRVRKAVAMVIDAAAISDKIYRGMAFPAQMLVGPMFIGFDEKLNQRLPVDLAGAKKLMAEAGYADGFDVDFDCPSQIYMNDEQVCQAISIMVAGIGIRAKPVINPVALFGERVGSRPPGSPAKASFRMNGYASGSLDSSTVAQTLLHTPKPNGLGSGNVTGWSNAEFDAILEKTITEGDLTKRAELSRQYWTIMQREMPLFGLLQPPIIWAMRDNVVAEPSPLGRVAISDIKLN